MSTLLTLSIVSLTSLFFLSGCSVRVCVRWPDYGIRSQDYCSVNLRRSYNSQLLLYEEAVSLCRLNGGFVHNSALGRSDFAAPKTEVNYSGGSQRSQVSGRRLRAPSLNCSKSVTTRPGCNVVCSFKTCPVGTFGLPDCHLSCRCENPDHCDISSGLCIATNCRRGFFGPPVCRKCNCHLDSLCNRETGQCPFGCKNGWHGKSCYQRICRDGNCRRSVSNGDDNCEDGANCTKRACPEGFFGPPACNKTCYCLYAQFCDVIDGNCANTPCLAGRTGPACQETECDLMHFGMPRCLDLCFCNANQPCDMTTGVCPIGCRQGWSGKNCNQRLCPEVFYNYPACNLECYCMNKDACNSITGVCEVDGCADGRQIKNCTKKPPGPQTEPSNYSSLSAFALIFGTVVVILAVCVQSMTHRQEPQSSRASTMTSAAPSSGSSSSIQTLRKSRMSFIQKDNRYPYLSVASREPAFALSSVSDQEPAWSKAPTGSTCVDTRARELD
ncbi:hypothetical protein BsWGS_23652 [Bradybaena similaris]